MNNSIKAFLIIVLYGLVLYGCSKAPKEDLAGTHDYENREFAIVVKVYDTTSQLNKSLSKEFDISNATREGFTSWIISSDMKDMDICTIHVVRPSHSDDNAEFTTWGHELTHCVYGTFHKE